MSENTSGKKGNKDKKDKGKTEEEIKAKEERRKLYEAQRAEKSKAQSSSSADSNVGKSKAQLKAERRAKQEAQRAEKAKQAESPSTKSKAEDGKNVGDNSQQRPKKTTSSTSTSVPRVSANVQMDNEKVKKKITKTLAKQNVPQRSTTEKKVQMFSHLYQYEKDISLTKSLRYYLKNEFFFSNAVFMRNIIL